MNINGLTTWFDLPDGYWNLDRDDPLRLVLRQEAGYQSILKNAEVLEDLELSDILPRVFEKTDSGIITHEMRIMIVGISALLKTDIVVDSRVFSLLIY